MEFSKKYFGAVMSVLLLEGRTAQLSTYESNLFYSIAYTVLAAF